MFSVPVHLSRWRYYLLPTVAILDHPVEESRFPKNHYLSQSLQDFNMSLLKKMVLEISEHSHNSIILFNQIA